VEKDASECHDLSSELPEKLAELVELWWSEARAHQVLPLDNRPFSKLVFDRPKAVPPRQIYVYYPGCSPVPETVAANVRNRPHRIVVDVEVPDGVEAHGVLLAHGSGLGGWSLFLMGGHPEYVHNYVGLEEHRVAADGSAGESELPLRPGRHRVEYVFEKTGEHKGTGRLIVDGATVGRGLIPRFTPMRFSLTGAGLTCGYGDGLAVSRRYSGPFAFNGEVVSAYIQVDGDAFGHPEGEAHIAITTQ